MVFISSAITDLAVRWQSGETASRLNRIELHPWQFVWSLALLGLWIYGLSRFFRFIGWPRWWSLPAVLLILLPWGWLYSDRKGSGFITLLLLQSPVVVAYVWLTDKRR